MFFKITECFRKYCNAYGNSTCANKTISISGCNGLTSIVYKGKTYDLIEIGGQCWFKNNLKTDTMRNGDLIGSSSGSSDPYWSTRTTPYRRTNNSWGYYVYLYNWFAVNSSKGLCPSGWHVPSDCDWMYLEKSLGMDLTELENFGWRGTNEGGKLKCINFNGSLFWGDGNGDWYAPNIGATNSSGFEAAPTGYASSGEVHTDGLQRLLIGLQPTEILLHFMRLYRELNYDESKIYRVAVSSNGVRNGRAVRCIKDAGYVITTCDTLVKDTLQYFIVMIHFKYWILRF